MAPELLQVFTKDLERGTNGGDTFADDTNVNHTAGIKANYTLLQKDLTVLKAGQEDGTTNAVLVQTQATECVHILPKSA